MRREIPIGKMTVLDSQHLGDDGSLFECHVTEGRVTDVANLRGISVDTQVLEASVASLHPQPPHVFSLDVRVPEVRRGSACWVRITKEAIWQESLRVEVPMPRSPKGKIDYFEVYEVKEVP